MRQPKFKINEYVFFMSANKIKLEKITVIYYQEEEDDFLYGFDESLNQREKDLFSSLRELTAQLEIDFTNDFKEKMCSFYKQIEESNRNLGITVKRLEELTQKLDLAKKKEKRMKNKIAKNKK